jgi:DNA-binding transcriptional regulator YhcF (GntR family)
MNFQDVLTGVPEAMTRLAELGDVHEADLTAFGFRKTDDRYTCAGQVINRAMVRHLRLRLCPRCLQEDMSLWAHLGHAAPFVRSAWLLAPIRICVKHRISFAQIDPPEGSQSLVALHDFSHRMQSLISRIEHSLNSSHEIAPTSLERYLSDRLHGIPGMVSEWLERMPFYAVSRASEIIGATEIYGFVFPVNELDDGQLRTAGSVGFDIMSQGAEEVATWLRKTSAKVPIRSGHAGGRIVYGELHRWLQEHVTDPGYAPLRALVADAIIDVLALRPNHRILGQTIREQRLHSVRSIAQDTGIHPKTVRKLLHHAGWLEKSGVVTTDDRTVLRADKNLESFLSDLKESMPIERAAQHIGLTRGRFMSLVDANIIKPLVPSNGDLKSLSFLKADLDDLLERLRARTIPRTDSDRDFMPLIFAAQAANRPLSEVVQAVLDGRVTRVVDDFDRLRFNSVCIAKDEICRLLHVGEKQGLSLREAARNLTTTVSVILALREIGMLEIVKAANPINRYPQNIVSVESVAAFGKTYVNLFQLARDWGQHHLIVLDKLTKAGIRPAFDRGEIGSRFFERSKLPPL